MERDGYADKERNAEVKRKIRKVGLPCLLCVLIVVNLMIVPKIFESNHIAFESVNMPMAIEEGSIQLLPPVAVRKESIQEEIRNSVDDNDNKDNDVVVIDNNANNEAGQEKQSGIAQNGDKGDNANTKEGKKGRTHVQHRGFRLLLFLLVVVIVSLIFIMIIYNSEKNYEHSRARAHMYEGW